MLYDPIAKWNIFVGIIFVLAAITSIIVEYRAGRKPVRLVIILIMAWLYWGAPSFNDKDTTYAIVLAAFTGGLSILIFPILAILALVILMKNIFEMRRWKF